MSFNQINGITVPGLIAGTAITQYSVVKFQSTDDKVVAVTATSDVGVGICQNDPATGEAAEVVFSGVAKAIAGTSTIAQGNMLGFNTTARVANLSVNTTTDDRPSIGVALQDAAAAADVIRVFVKSGYGG
jgi:hypothetical protein